MVIWLSVFVHSSAPYENADCFKIVERKKKIGKDKL
jgi:hypothetical protein